MSRARVLVKLGWRAYVVKVEVGRGVDSLDAAIRDIWRKEFADVQPCECLAEVLLDRLEGFYPDCFIEVKVLAMGFQESASVDNAGKLMVQYEEDRQTGEEGYTDANLSLHSAAPGHDGKLGSGVCGDSSEQR